MKACPFCGSEARLYSYRKSYRPDWAQVVCRNGACKARGPRFERHAVAEPKLPGEVTYAEVRDGAVRGWNQRSNEAPYQRPSCGAGQCFCGGCP